LTAEKLSTNSDYAENTVLLDGSRAFRINVPVCTTATILVRGTS